MKKSYIYIIIGVLGIILVSIGITASFSKSKSIEEDVKLIEGVHIFVPENTFDWGYTVNRQRLTHKYPIINMGTDTLRILNVRTTCGCTKRQMGKTVLAAGETTFVTLEFRTGGYRGRQRKSAYVTTNDTTNPRVQLSFTAMLDSTTQKFIPSPTFYNFGTTEGNEYETAIKIYNKSLENVEFKVVDYPDNFVEEVKLKDSKVPSGGSTELVIKIYQELAPDAYKIGSVTIEASDTDNTRLTIPIQVLK
ncbi:DUF1573 domain-containing protein [bacterium]|nr:DUF1573 domain-containing protein [bacterium]